MKKYLLGLITVTLLTGVYFIFKTAINPTKTIKMPAASLEEDGHDREEWDRMRLADPSTGKIPAGIQFKEQAFARELAASVALERDDNDWSPRGPWNVGGRTRAFALDVTNEQRILAGGVSGGIWLSEDGGGTWSRRTAPNAHPGCVSIAQDTRTGMTNIWYYLSGEIVGTSASGGGSFYLGDGMFKSTDGGLTWAALGTTDDGTPQSFSDLWQSGWRVAVQPITGDVYVATYSCIFRSNNGGTSFTPVLGGINVSPFSYYTDLAISPAGVLYATFSSEGAKKGVWRSTNGTTWTDITPTTGFPEVYDRFAIGINPNDEYQIYIFGSTPNSGHYTKYINSDDWQSLWKYTYITGNGAGTVGGAWENLSNNLPDTGTEFDKCSVQGGYDLVVQQQPGTNTVIIGGTNLWRSTDGFASTDNTTKIGGYKIGTTLPFFEIYPGHHPDIHGVRFLPSDSKVMFTYSDGGIHRSDDCAAPFVNWNSLNHGYQTTQFYTAMIEHSTAGDNTLMGGLQDNGNFFSNSDDPQAPWVQTVNGDGAYGAIPDGKPFYILSIQQGRVVKCNLSDNGNVTGFQRMDPIGPLKDDYLFINPLALDPADQNKMFLPAGNRIFRHNDLASIPLLGEWDSISAGWSELPMLPDTNEVISAIGVSKSNPSHTMYVGTAQNTIYRYDNADTDAPTVTALTSPLTNPVDPTDTKPYVTCIAVDPDDASNVLLVFSNYSVYSIFQSLDGGLTWKKVAGNLETALTGGGSSPSVRWVNIMAFPDGTRRYFCATSTGLYSTTVLKVGTTPANGTKWLPEGNTNIGSVVVNYVDSRAADGLVVAATHGHGMWSAHFDAPVGTHSAQTPTVNVRLSPNPTSRMLNISVEGKDNEMLHIRILNMKGQVVQTHEWRGNYKLLDLQRLESGTYAYQLSGKGWAKSGALVVVK